jgi:hypothetical protein
MAFEGFPRRALDFLAGLAHNNAEPRVNGSIFHHFEPPLLARYRDAVAEPERGSALVQAVERVEGARHAIGNVRYKRLPTGCRPVPPQAHTPELPTVCAARFAEPAPLQAWVVDLQAS